MRDRGFWIAFTLYLVLMVSDFVTTLMNPNWTILEINPIYAATGMMWPIFALNILLAWGLYSIYKKSGPNMRFICMNTMIVVILGRVFAVKNAIAHLQNPLTEGQALALLNDGVSAAATTNALALLMYVPLVLTFITYIFWKLDHEVEAKQ